MNNLMLKADPDDPGMYAFRACYADWKLVKTRSVVQIVLEIPVEQADQAYAVLGGMPIPGSETWVAVARLNVEEKADDVTCEQPAQEPEPPVRAKRKWDDLPLPTQAGTLCGTASFNRFMHERHGAYPDREGSATALRQLCKVQSRADLWQPEAASIFRTIVGDYRAWLRT